MPQECYQRGKVVIHPIEARSYQILSEQFDFTPYDGFQRSVVKRVIHATADFELAGSLAFSTGAAERAIAAIKAQSPVVCDVEMVRAGITSYITECFLRQTEPTATGIPTRSYMAMAKAAQQYPTNAIFVVGCAPTALYALIGLADQEWFKPALVIGLPVGFVGASESKAALRKSTLPYITNTGNKGGSPAASAAFNSLVRIAKENRGHDDS
ncbi:MAG: precorrin-8X methylmutase [Acidimicrobiaceae bacterium]|nr:precorrin-8X methylmutase [Acidimicrobiaceae bacterium]